MGVRLDGTGYLYNLDGDVKVYPIHHSGFSLSFWMRASGGATLDGNIVSFGQPFDPSPNLSVSALNGASSHTIGVRTAVASPFTSYGGGTTQTIQSTATIPHNQEQWSHIAVVTSGNDDNKEIHINLWVNGVHCSGIHRVIYTGGALDRLYIGNGPITGTDFAGLIAELGVWSGCLEPYEVSGLYAGSMPINIRPDLLQEYFPLLENDVTNSLISLTDLDTDGTLVKCHNHPRVFRPSVRQIEEVVTDAVLPLCARGYLPYHSGDGEFSSAFNWSFYNQLQGEPPGWHMNLHCQNDAIVVSSGIDLYTSAFYQVNNLQGAYDDSYGYDFDIENPLPMFLQVLSTLPDPDPDPSGTIDDPNSMNLFIKGISFARPSSGDTSLFTFGFENSGIFDHVDMSISGHRATAITKTSNLFLAATPSGNTYMNLWIGAGIDQHTGNIPLHLQVLDQASGTQFPLTIWNPTNRASGDGLQLFTYSTEGTGIYNQANLFTGGLFGISNSGEAFPLYAHCVGSGNTNINLYLYGEEIDEINSIPDNSMNLVLVNNYNYPTNHVLLSVFNQLTDINSNISLYLNNEITVAGLTLLLDAAGPFGQSGAMNLYMNRSSDSLDFNLPLFMDGSGTGYLSGGIDLITSGNYSSFETTDLFTLGVTTDTAEMPLFLNSRDASDASGFFPLFSWASENPGIYKFTDLFLQASALSGLDTSNIRLFLRQDSSLSYTNTMNLFLNSYGNADGSITYYNDIPLTAYNNAVVDSGILTLFMNAPSGTDGAIPFSGTMNLVMWREIESAALNMPFYTSGPEGTNSGVDLYLQGQPVPTGTISMYLDGGRDSSTGLIKLYTHGF